MKKNTQRAAKQGTLFVQRGTYHFNFVEDSRQISQLQGDNYVCLQKMNGKIQGSELRYGWPTWIVCTNSSKTSKGTEVFPFPDGQPGVGNWRGGERILLYAERAIGKGVDRRSRRAIVVWVSVSKSGTSRKSPTHAKEVPIDVSKGGEKRRTARCTVRGGWLPGNPRLPLVQ